MGFNFRKSFKVAPGIKVNLGKKSAGVSIGGKYGGVSMNTKTGTRLRVSAPGTGLSYSTKLGSTSRQVSEEPDAATVFNDAPPKNKWVAFLLCLFFGYIGIHKFYEGKIGMGILYMFTLGLFGFGWIYDIVVLLLKPNPYYL